MKEQAIEQFLVKGCQKRGWFCVKLAATGWAGMPDRMILGPGGKVCFVELKSPGKKPRKLQSYRLQQLAGLGFWARVVDSKEGAQELMDGFGGMSHEV